MAGISVIEAGEISPGSTTPAKKVGPKAKPIRKAGGPKQVTKK